MPKLISHALVLPDKDFQQWYSAAQQYVQTFERVAVVRSPAGFNLNRFRNVTAVQTPGLWLNDNALEHIRRVYPMVVRVDVVTARTPAELKTRLDRRARANDRFGETENADKHIHDRFTLDMPVNIPGTRISRTFNQDVGGNKSEGVHFNAPVGTPVKAAVGGVVAVVSRQPTALNYGEYVQISTSFGGVTYLATYAQLQNIRVQMGQQVALGDPIAESGQAEIKLVVQTPGKGQPGYVLPDVIDPTPLLFWEGFRVRATGDGLRLREKPGTQFKSLAQANVIDALDVLELHGRALAKIGVKDQWLQVRHGGIDAYAAAWLLQTFDMDEIYEVFPGVDMLGMNLDYMHPLGRPAPQRLTGLGWMRLAYNVSFNPDNNSYGNQNLDVTFQRYRPFLQAYAAAGFKIMLVLTHQTYGEGAGYVWPQMNDDRWRREFTPKWLDVVRRIAGQFKGSGLVHCYQIWNEQDAPPEAQASVTMPAPTYGYLLGETIKAIRAIDSTPKIISGGHTGGPVKGSQYARAALASTGGVVPDGVAVHPYGRGVTLNTPYTIFGHIDEEVRAYGSILPDRPIWITEWGVLDRPNDNPNDVLGYASSVINYLRSRYPGRIATLLWYAWATGMHNGYGLVDTRDQPRQPFHDAFLRA